MKMRKKLTALLLAAVMLLPFALASCKDGTDESSAGSDETSSATSEESIRSMSLWTMRRWKPSTCSIPAR